MYFMSGSIYFASFCLLIYFYLPDTDVITTLFCWCITLPSNYEDKLLVQHLIMQNSHIHWPVMCMI